MASSFTAVLPTDYFTITFGGRNETGGEKTMQNSNELHVGDIYEPLCSPGALDGFNCSNFQSDYNQGKVRYIKILQEEVLSIDPYIPASAYQALDANMQLAPNTRNRQWAATHVGCCVLRLNQLRKVTSATKAMDLMLYRLTPEQKEGLSADDQALFERGIISSELVLRDSAYVLNFLFKKFKGEMAAQAAKEIAEYKAELKKRK